MRQFSIRQQVAWLTLAPLLVMAICLESFFLHDRFDELDDNLVERGRLIARQVAASSEYGVFSSNRFYLQNIAQGALQQPDVRGVAILNAASESLYEGGSATGPDRPRAGAGLWAQGQSAQGGGLRGLVDAHTPVRSDDENLWLYQPIVSAQVVLDAPGSGPGAQQLGAVVLEMSRARTGQLKTRLLWLTAGVTLLFLAILSGLVHYTSRRITSPIRKLSRAVQEIGSGRLETRVAASSQVSELNAMERGINEMAAQLQQEAAALRQRVEEATHLAALAFESHEGMMITDAGGAIVRVNKAFTRMTGYTPDEAVGRTPALLKSGMQRADFYEAMWEKIRATGTWQGELWNRRRSGEIYPVWTAITAVEKSPGEVAYYVATYTDITERKAAESEINSLVYYDALTRLPNRRMFADRFSQAAAAGRRSGRYGALMFLDLDNFKPLNDRHGHAAGDQLLTEVARRLVHCIREVDTVARFGGDEFVVMLTELDADRAESEKQAALVAEKIRAALAEPYSLTVQPDRDSPYAVEHRCTTSIGVALFLGHEAGMEEAVKHADRAMYRAKEEGRNMVRFYEANHRQG